MTNIPIGSKKRTVEGLEVFDEGIDFLKLDTLSSRIKYSGKKAGDFIVRYALTSVPSRLPMVQNGLESFLQTFDNHLEQSAATVGATVVEHTWGLVERTSAHGFYNTPELADFGINDYLLAARVMILPGTRVSFQHGVLYSQLEERLQKTRSEQLSTQGWTSDAVRAVQFTVQRQQGDMSLYLHDIEPRIIG